MAQPVIVENSRRLSGDLQLDRRILHTYTVPHSRQAFNHGLARMATEPTAGWEAAKTASDSSQSGCLLGVAPLAPFRQSAMVNDPDPLQPAPVPVSVQLPVIEPPVNVPTMVSSFVP